MLLDYLVKIFTSPVAIFLVMSLVILWLVRMYMRKDRQLDELYRKTIRYLELKLDAAEKLYRQ